MIDKNIANHSKKIDSTTKLPFYKIDYNEVPRDAQYAFPSDKIKIPLS